MGSIPLYAPAPTATSAPTKRSSSAFASKDPPSKKSKSRMQAQTLFIPRNMGPKGKGVAEVSPAGGDKEKMNTARTNNWAINVFQEWKTTKNQSLKNLTSNPEDCIPDDILDRNYGSDDVSVDPLAHWLPVLFDEARSKDGRIYPPASLQGLFFAILRAMRQKNPLAPNFMSRKDLRFKALHDKLDGAFLDHEEHASGAQKRLSTHMTSITPEQENQLWEQGILGTDSPFKLLRAVFYYMSRVFFIKGATKHRYLRFSQFKRETNPDRYTYVAAESGPKNKKPHGIQMNSNFSPVYHANPAAGERCLVYLLDLYISKLPDNAFEEGIFYHRPLAFVPKDVSCPWYGPSAVGLERLRVMAREIFNSAAKNQSQLPTGVLPSDSSNGQSLHMNELQEKATETLQVFTSSVPQVFTSSVPEISTCGQYQNAIEPPAVETFRVDEDSEPCEVGEVDMEELESQILQTSTHEDRILQLHERPAHSSITQLSLEHHANLFSSEKNGSELHIYDSGPYSMYIFIQRRKNKRRSRQGSCPPINV